MTESERKNLIRHNLQEKKKNPAKLTSLSIIDAFLQARDNTELCRLEKTCIKYHVGGGGLGFLGCKL